MPDITLNGITFRGVVGRSDTLPRYGTAALNSAGEQRDRCWDPDDFDYAEGTAWIPLTLEKKIDTITSAIEALSLAWIGDAGYISAHEEQAPTQADLDRIMDRIMDYSDLQLDWQCEQEREQERGDQSDDTSWFYDRSW